MWYLQDLYLEQSSVLSNTCIHVLLVTQCDIACDPVPEPSRTTVGYLSSKLISFDFVLVCALCNWYNIIILIQLKQLQQYSSAIVLSVSSSRADGRKGIVNT